MLKVGRRSLLQLAAGVIAGDAALGIGRASLAAEPLKIGLGMAQTGSLAGNGKAGLLALQMWADDVNAKGGLVGRPVQLIHYDDQSNPSIVPGLYTKLIDIDKVDLVVGGYGTGVQAAAMPLVMQHELTFMCLFGLGVNEQFHYDRFFQILPAGHDAHVAQAEGFFEVAATMDPKPKTIGIVGADSEFSQTSMSGARELAKKYGMSIVFDRAYPPASVDFNPIIHALQASNPEFVFVASYPTDTAGILRSVAETGFKTRLLSGPFVGLQFASLKQQFGSKLNGLVFFETYVPSPTMEFPGIADFLSRYQAKAAAAGVDALGFYLPPFAYAAMQALGQAVEATKGTDQAKLAEYLHKTTFSTIVGNLTWGKDGEWAKPRSLVVQAQGIEGNDLEQFKKPGKEVILAPAEYKSGSLQYPYTDIKH